MNLKSKEHPQKDYKDEMKALEIQPLRWTPKNSALLPIFKLKVIN